MHIRRHTRSIGGSMHSLDGSTTEDIIVEQVRGSFRLQLPPTVRPPLPLPTKTTKLTHHSPQNHNPNRLPTQSL